jgi:tRNA wybutosine-synthesizing protein 1
LTIQNSPWHAEVCEFSEALAARLHSRGKSVKYSIATEHEHSCCILLAREDKFKVDGKWHTWIDYDKFYRLISNFYSTAGKATFKSSDYMMQTPDWALYKSSARGFDPMESRWRRNAKGDVVENEYKSSESGCG